jgi:hypothetical protein
LIDQPKLFYQQCALLRRDFLQGAIADLASHRRFFDRGTIRLSRGAIRLWRGMRGRNSHPNTHCQRKQRTLHIILPCFKTKTRKWLFDDRRKRAATFDAKAAPNR